MDSQRQRDFRDFSGRRLALRGRRSIGAYPHVEPEPITRGLLRAFQSPVCGLLPFIPILPLGFERPLGDWHERRNIAPEVVTAIVPASSPDPFLRRPDVLHNHRNVTARCLARFALDTELSVEQLDTQIGWGKRLGSLPRHSAIAETLGMD